MDIEYNLLEGSGYCLSCTRKCCGEPDVLIPLGDRELGSIPSYLKTEYFGIPVMLSNERGCSAYDTTTTYCQIYPDRPVYCRVFPFKLVAKGIRAGFCENDPLIATDFGIHLSPCLFGVNIKYPEKIIPLVIDTLSRESELLKRIKILARRHDVYLPCELTGFFNILEING